MTKSESHRRTASQDLRFCKDLSTNYSFVPRIHQQNSNMACWKRVLLGSGVVALLVLAGGIYLLQTEQKSAALPFPGQLFDDAKVRQVRQKRQSAAFGKLSQYVNPYGTARGGYCPDSQVPYINPTNYIAQGCLSPPGCPTGYTCQISTTSQYLCCGSMGSCPAGMTVYRDATSHPISCAGQSAPCPTGSQCTTATGGTQPQFLCCQTGSTARSVTCPGGQQPEQQNGAPKLCSPGANSACGTGFTCTQGNVAQTSSGPIVTNVCCPTGSPTSIACPSGFSPEMNNGAIQTCAINIAGSCTSPYVCMQAQGSTVTICCQASGTSASNTCPGTQTALSVAGQIQYCTTRGQQCTVPGYVCQLAATGSQLLCCGYGNQISQVQCSSGRQPYLLGTNPFYCTPQAANCPSSYACEPSTLSTGQYICCSSTGTTVNVLCQDGSTPYLDGANPRQCTLLGANACPNGYICEATTGTQPTGCCRAGGISTPGACPGGGALTRQTACVTTAECSAPSTCVQTTNGVLGCCQGGTGGTLGTCPGGGTLSKQISCASSLECAPPSTCVATSSGVQGCCQGGTGGSPGVCPGGGTLSRQTACTSSVDCTTPSTCVVTNNGVQGCCQGGNAGSPGTCPNGGSLTSAFSCTSTIDCPSTATCTQTSNGVLGCCQGGTASNQRCSNGQLADLRINGQPRPCNPSSPSCSQGYECGRAEDNTQSICCQGPRCPGGITTGSGPNGAPLECSLGSTNSCPSGQTCTTATNIPGRSICCPN